MKLKRNSLLSFLIILSQLVLSQQKCKLIGETVALLYGTITIHVDCSENEYHFTSVGIQSANKMYYGLLAENPTYREYKSFFNRYLLKFENNTLFLMDVDLFLQNTLIVFFIEFSNGYLVKETTNSLYILYEKALQVSSAERLKNNRHLSVEYALSQNKKFKISWNNYEIIHAIKILDFYIIDRENHFIIDSPINIDTEIRKIHKSNVFFVSQNGLEIITLTNQISTFTIGLKFLYRDIEKVTSLRNFKFINPIKILESSTEKVRWEIKSFVRNYLIIFYIHPLLFFRQEICNCKKNNNYFICFRNNKLSNLFGDINEHGLEIVTRNICYFSFDLKYDGHVNIISTSVSSNLFLNISDKMKSFGKSDFKRSWVNDVHVLVDYLLLKKTNILNISIYNLHVYKPSIERYAKYSIFFDGGKTNLCTLYGPYIKLEYNYLSTHVLECKSNHITMYNYQNIFNSNAVCYQIKATQTDMLSFCGFIIRSSFFKTKLNYREFFKRYNRIFYGHETLNVGKENSFTYENQNELYSLLYFGVILGNNTKYSVHEQKNGEKDGIEELDIFLKDWNKLIIRNPFLLENAVIIMKYTDGINKFIDSTWCLKIDRQILKFENNNQTHITWSVTVNHYELTLFIHAFEKLFEIGTCSNNVPCVLRENPLIKKLGLNDVQIVEGLNLHDWIVVIKISPLIGETVNQEIEFHKLLNSLLINYEIFNNSKYKGSNMLRQMESNQSSKNKSNTTLTQVSSTHKKKRLKNTIIAAFVSFVIFITTAPLFTNGRKLYNNFSTV